MCSRKFEAFSLKWHHGGFFEDINVLATGWTAQYEIWNVSSDDVTIDEDWHFELDQEEVMIQISHFSTLRPTNLDGLGGSNLCKDLKIHFPTSIGNDVNLFTILRTVYTRKLFCGTNEPETTQARNIWRVIPMPLEYRGDSTFLLFSQPGLEKNVEDNEQAVRLDTRQVFNIRSQDRYIVYVSVKSRISVDDFDEQSDYEGEDSDEQSNRGEAQDHETDEGNAANAYSGNSGYNSDSKVEIYQDDQPESESLATSIAVFTLASDLGDRGLRLLDYLSYSGQDEYINKFSFHPRLPLLAFHYGCEYLGKIILWNFESLSCAGSDMPSNGRFETVAESIHWVDCLQFSDCGKEVIYMVYAADRPLVIPVYEMTLYQSVEACFKNRTEHSTSTSESLGSKKPASLSSSQSQIILYRQGEITMLNFRPSRVQTDLELIRSRDGSQVLQPILTIPARADAKFVRLDMLPARNLRDQKFRVIMTKTPRLFYTFSCDADQTSTAIIEKDTRALFDSRKSIARGQGLDWEAMPPILKYSNEVFQPSIEQSNPNKKLRLH